VGEPLQRYLDVAQSAARIAGRLLQDWRGRFQVREKGPSDLVTEADFAAQEAVRTELLGAFPEHGFLAEENGASLVGRDGYRWIVDPLDGTTNYVHGLHQYCVSIALERAGSLLAGVVYDPSANECFAAAAGQGATLNGRPIRTSDVTNLSQALVAASFPPRVRRDHPTIGEFLGVMEQAQAVRRMGSSALNLCYVALGRLDAYWASDTNGGGEPDLARPRFVAAANASLAAELRDAVGA
jgi:myo-inositol-1(or 4)-monophosphatase